MNHSTNETLLTPEMWCLWTAILVLLVLELSYTRRQQIEQDPQQGRRH